MHASNPRIVLMLALLVALPLASPVPAAEDKLVVYTAYEENELKTFWEQFKKDLPDLAAKASYIRGSTGPTMARIEAERANPQADVIWGVFNDYLTGAAKKGLLEPYAAKESQAIPAPLQAAGEHVAGRDAAHRGLRRQPEEDGGAEAARRRSRGPS